MCDIIEGSYCVTTPAIYVFHFWAFIYLLLECVITKSHLLEQLALSYYASGLFQCFHRWATILNTYSLCMFPSNKGAVLDPLLFIIYTKDPSNSPQKCKSILFADDAAIHKSSKNLDELYDCVNADCGKHF